MSVSIDRAHAVLDYWFGPSRTNVAPNHDLWFSGTPEIDQDIRQRFAVDVEKARDGLYDDWIAEKYSCLALIVLLDQFSLNIFRDLPKSFDTAAQAIPLARHAIRERFDAGVHVHMRGFFYQLNIRIRLR